MTTIKITDGRPADHEHEVTVETLADFAAGEPRARDCPGPSSPIMLSVHEDYEAAGVWLSPAKAREVIAALQAAVDEVEPLGDALRFPGDPSRFVFVATDEHYRYASMGPATIHLYAPSPANRQHTWSVTMFGGSVASGTARDFEDAEGVALRALRVWSLAWHNAAAASVPATRPSAVLPPRER